MSYYLLVTCGVGGLVTALVVLPILIRRTAESSGGRATAVFHHTHQTPVSRLGGLAFAIAFVLVSILVIVFFPEDAERTLVRYVLVVTSLMMFILGLWDDLKPLGAKKKLIGQLLIASMVCAYDIRIETVTNPFGGNAFDLGWLSWPVTMIWLVGLTNMINLIDGIDGLAAGVSLMLMGLLIYVGVSGGLTLPLMVAAGMAGALIGFLRYNFPPAKIYMGDSGAYFLGFLIAMLTLLNSHKGTVMAALVAPLFALALPILDISLAIMRRGLRGLPIFRPDRGHLHHKLVEIGFSRTRAVLVLYGLSSVFLLIAFAVFWSQGRWVPILLGLGCLILLMTARSFSFSRKWLSVGRAFETSIQLRKDSQYALIVSRWLELESERVLSVEELWDDLVFMSSRMGFTRVTLELEDGRREWISPRNATVVKPMSRTHELGGSVGKSIEFCGDEDTMSDVLFGHVCELCAEAWHNAAVRWQAVNRMPVRFDSRCEERQSGQRPAPLSKRPSEKIAGGKSA